MNNEIAPDWLLESARNQPHLKHLVEGTPVARSSETLVDPKSSSSNPLVADELLWLGQEPQSADLIDAQKRKQESMESLFPYGYNPPFPLMYLD